MSQLPAFPLAIRSMINLFLFSSLRHLDTITVECPGAPPAYFVGQTWIGPNTKLEIKIPVSWTNPKEEIATYKVHVYTSDEKNAGTDAGILLEIFGDRASSGKQALLDM